MSTRSATIVRGEKPKWVHDDEIGLYKHEGTEIVEIARFYRHCDGYPEGHGLEMATSFDNTGGWDGRDWSQKVFGPFMTGEGTKGTDFESWGAPTLEFEPSSARHGDLEYLYAVTKMHGGKLQIAVWEIGWDEDYGRVLAREPMFAGEPLEYIEWIDGR